MKTPEFAGYLEPIARSKSSNVEVFKDFVRMSACALACGSREKEYLEVAGRYDNNELGEISKSLGLLINEMEADPFADILGNYYQEIASKSTRDNRGEFFTPPEISKLMAKVVINADKIIEEGLPVTMSEPACGSGGMILQAASLLAPKKQGDPSYVDLLRATAQDISPVSVDMTYINTTMWGIPAHMIHGNTLNLEVWNRWKNPHWHRVGEDERLQLEKVRDFLKSPGPSPSPRDVVSNDISFEAVPIEQVKQKEGNDGQFEFDL